MTIRKYLGCDGPDCISNVEVPLGAPLRDLLPEHWRAIMVEGSRDELASVDAHFCSLACLYHWTAERISQEAIAEGATRQDPPEDPPDAAASGVLASPNDPAPAGSAAKSLADLRKMLDEATSAPYNPLRSQPWENYGATWDAGAALRGGVTLYNAGAGANWYGAGGGALAGQTSAWPEYRQLTGAAGR